MRIIAGKFRNRSLKSPKGIETRPTSEKLRGAVFNMLQSTIEGSDFLDLFAGSGAMGFEALSRGANRAVFIDSNPEALNAIAKNIESLRVDTIAKLIKGDVFSALKRLDRLQEPFDIIYADPPYMKAFPGTTLNDPESIKILKALDESNLLKEGGLLFIEESCNVPLNDIELSSLAFLKKKSYGSSSLHQFVYKGKR